MKRIVLSFLILLTVNLCYSQKPILTKSVIEQFTPINGGTVLTTVSDNDDASQLLDIGSLFNFSFKFNGTVYNKLYISSNGTISLNNDFYFWVNDVSDALGNSPNIDLIAPWWDDLYSRRTDVNEGTSTYLITGSAPNRQITIEWDMFHHYVGFDADDQKVTFQVTIYENSDRLKFNYKRNNFINYTMSASIGFKFIDNSFLALNHGSDPAILNSSSTLVNNIDQADFSDYQDNFALYFGNFAPTFNNPTGPITLCQNGSYFLDPSTTIGTWTSVDPTIALFNSSGYVTGLQTGTTDVSLTTLGGTVTATVTVGSTSSLTITDPTAQPNYKFISNTAQGPVDTNGGTLNYVGYNGFNYSSQTKPTNTGYYRASKQVGNEAGCPVPFYIIKCDACQ